MANPGEVYCANCSRKGTGMNESTVYIILPPNPMRCIKTGAIQLNEAEEDMMQNVDIFECQYCGNKVAKR